MQIIPIKNIPNQEFSIVLGENRWDITLRQLAASVTMTLVRNNELVVTNARVVSGMRIIPARYQEDGNFIIITQNGVLPDYTRFGITQDLIYVSAEELDVIRARNPAVTTVADFDPQGGLPLRFAPQGYTLAP